MPAVPPVQHSPRVKLTTDEGHFEDQKLLIWDSLVQPSTDEPISSCHPRQSLLLKSMLNEYFKLRPSCGTALLHRVLKSPSQEQKMDGQIKTANSSSPPQWTLPVQQAFLFVDATQAKTSRKGR